MSKVTPSPRVDEWAACIMLVIATAWTVPLVLLAIPWPNGAPPSPLPSMLPWLGLAHLVGYPIWVGVYALVCRLRDASHRWTTYWPATVALLLPLSGFVLWWAWPSPVSMDIAAGERIVDRLEAYHRQDGRWPERLADLPGAPARVPCGRLEYQGGDNLHISGGLYYIWCDSTGCEFT